MADIYKFCIQFLLLIVVFSGVIEAYQSCSDRHRFFSQYILCEDDQYCCEKNGRTACCDYNLTVGAIVGIVIGAMFVIGLIGVCICICAQKSKAKQGHVIHPANQGTIRTQQMSQPYGAPGQGNMYGGPPGPSYVYGGQQGAPPPYGEPQYPPHPEPNGLQQTK